MEDKGQYFNVPAEMFLSKDGEWFHDGEKITHKGIIDRLNKNIRRDGDDYFVVIGYERAKVTVEDAPYFILGVRRDDDKLVLELSDGTKEPFDPSTLEIGEKNIPYARVKKTADKAKFTRPAYYQFARYLVEFPDGGCALRVGEKTYPLDV